MKICFDVDGREICFPIYVEIERHWPPIPPEEKFNVGDFVIEDPSWWRTAVTVNTIDHMADEVGGALGKQLHQAAAVGLESLQSRLPAGARLNLSTRVATAS